MEGIETCTQLGVKGNWHPNLKNFIVTTLLTIPEKLPPGLTINNIRCMVDTMEKNFDPIKILTTKELHNTNEYNAYNSQLNKCFPLQRMN